MALEVFFAALGGDREFRGIRAPHGPGTKYYESRLDIGRSALQAVEPSRICRVLRSLWKPSA